MVNRQLRWSRREATATTIIREKSMRNYRKKSAKSTNFSKYEQNIEWEKMMSCNATFHIEIHSFIQCMRIHVQFTLKLAH